VTSHYDRSLIVETMKSNGFDRVATAKVIGCHPTAVSRQMQMAARDTDKPYVNQKTRSGRGTGVARIKWTPKAMVHNFDPALTINRADGLDEIPW
jgi:hypothetical protein